MVQAKVFAEYKSPGGFEDGRQLKFIFMTKSLQRSDIVAQGDVDRPPLALQGVNILRMRGSSVNAASFLEIRALQEQRFTDGVHGCFFSARTEVVRGWRCVGIDQL